MSQSRRHGFFRLPVTAGAQVSGLRIRQGKGMERQPESGITATRYVKFADGMRKAAAFRSESKRIRNNAMAKKPDGKKAAKVKAAEEEEPQELEMVLFQGTVSGIEIDTKAHAKLVQAALVPAKEMVSDAMRRRAHTILIEPREGRFALRYTIDGNPYPAAALPGPRGNAMVQVLKMLAGLNPTERRESQFGGIVLEFAERKYHLFVESTPVGAAERLRIKIFDVKNILQKPQDIGMSESIKEKIREMTSERSGVVLVCGPPDSGVTTLSIVAVHTVDPYLYQVFNLADLKGRELINVSKFVPEEGHDLEVSFDRIIRREADVLFMDPLSSPQNAQTIFQYANRLSFIMEIPSKTPVEALQKLMEWVGVDVLLQGLKGVLTQKLVRKLCEDCKQAYRPNPALVKKLGLPEQTTVLYRPPAPPAEDDPEAPTVEELCGPCAGQPYHGRVAALELLEMTDGMKEVIATGLSPEAIRRQMNADGQITLQKDALRLVAEGKTSLEEVQRVFSGGGKKRPAKKRPRPPGATPG